MSNKMELKTQRQTKSNYKKLKSYNEQYLSQFSQNIQAVTQSNFLNSKINYNKSTMNSTTERVQSSTSGNFNKKTNKTELVFNQKIELNQQIQKSQIKQSFDQNALQVNQPKRSKNTKIMTSLNNIYVGIENQDQFKRFKCQCQQNIKNSQTCNSALTWIEYFDKDLDLTKLKNDYESKLKNTINEKIQIQINKDIDRINYKNILFMKENFGIQEIINVLKTLAIEFPQIGYVQGMHILTAQLIYHAEEYIAFFLMCQIIKSMGHQDSLISGLPGISKHSQILQILLITYEPEIASQLNQQNVLIELIICPWIISLFGILIPLENMKTFYDMFFEKGWKAFYQVSIQIFKTYKQFILNNDFINIQAEFSSVKFNCRTKLIQDWDQILQNSNDIEIDEDFLKTCFKKFNPETKIFQI